MMASPLAMLILLACTPAPRHSAPLRLVQTIPLPGVEGRIDHMAADPRGGRLFVAALGNDTLEVVLLHVGRRIQTIRGLHEPQGVAYVPQGNLLVVANGESGDCVVYDAGTYRMLRRIPLGDDADNVRLRPGSGQVVVGYGRGALATVDPSAGKRIGEVSLEAHPESFQIERSGSRIYVNVPDAGHIALIEGAWTVATGSAAGVVDRWVVQGARANFPMALDETGHRLFVGCRTPARLLIYDTHTGREIGSAPIAGDTDDIWFDPARKRIYASCGEGYVSVVAGRSPGRWREAARVATAPGARTSYYLADARRLCVAVPHRGAQRAEVRVYAVP